MGKIKDETGSTFGRLRVLYSDGLTSDRKAKWKCVCICGNTLSVSGGSLRSGLTRSCGCLQKEKATEASTKHGMAGKWKTQPTPEYTAYRNARARCTKTSYENYKDYGGRGIKFLFRDFKQFFSELGFRPEGKTLDRIDNNGNYEPGNVRWATPTEQYYNRDRGDSWQTSVNS